PLPRSASLVPIFVLLAATGMRATSLILRRPILRFPFLVTAMRNAVWHSRFALAAALALGICTSSHAQLFRAYLKSTGSDANNCTIQAPCRLLPAALNAVADGGEVWMLDSANFNTGVVNITKSVSILAIPGALGSLVATNVPAVSIVTAGITV